MFFSTVFDFVYSWLRVIQNEVVKNFLKNVDVRGFTPLMVEVNLKLKQKKLKTLN